MEANLPPLETIQKQIELINKVRSNPKEDELKVILKQLLEYRLAYAIFLLGTDFLTDIVKVQSKTKLSIFAACQESCPSIFKLRPDRASVLESIQKNQHYKDVLESKQIKHQPEEKQNKIRHLLELVIAAVLEGTAKSLGPAIEDAFYLKGLEADSKVITFNAFDEYAMNYLNSCLEQVRKKLQINNICCKTIYRQKEQIEPPEGASQEFKRYMWPISNVSIRTHLTKTIIGFLNSNGGIIFIGIMETKDKRNEAVGIELKPIEVKSIKDFITELVGAIHPKHEGFDTQVPNKEQDKNVNVPTQQPTSNSNFDYKINDYVRMEFIRVVDGNTYTNVEIRNDKKEHISNLYIVKIIVKIGHPKHLYHITNLEKNIDFYERKDRNVQKMQFPDAYNAIYKRLDDFEIFKAKYKTDKEKSKLDLKRNLFHSNCRYKMDDIQFILKDDKMDQDDDDDDDDE